MTRWEPGSRERLQGAALDLFSKQGFENTTVAEIATQAGVNRRTFFRHFTDKRDVLFAGAAELEALLVGRTVDAQSNLAPLDAIVAALAAIGTDSMVPRHYLRQRQAVIAASPELMERELIKFDSLSAAFADGLRQRGVDDPTAGLAAQAGVSILRTAYSRWAEADDGAEMGQIAHDVLAGFRAAVAAYAPGRETGRAHTVRSALTVARP
jgi:AcrR family transcriptional regulator